MEKASKTCANWKPLNCLFLGTNSMSPQLMVYLVLFSTPMALICNLYLSHELAEQRAGSKWRYQKKNTILVMIIEISWNPFGRSILFTHLAKNCVFFPPSAMFVPQKLREWHLMLKSKLSRPTTRKGKTTSSSQVRSIHLQLCSHVEASVESLKTDPGYPLML